MSQYFITGTDTDVGKTFVSALLVHALNARYWKPIQSGTPDTETVRKLMQISPEKIFPASYSLKAALSPDQAAALENIEIDLDMCRLPKTDSTLIVEGAGGIYAPLNANKMMLDLMKQLDIPVVIVTRGTLGTINHTLMTLDILRKNNLKIHGIIFCGKLNPDNQIAIEKWGAVKTLLHVPYFETPNFSELSDWVQQQEEGIRRHFL
jgi:dethiobiotin synthase